MLTPVQIVGIGLNGMAGLADSVRQIVEQATLLVGSDRHLSYVAHHRAEQWVLGDFHTAVDQIRQHLKRANDKVDVPVNQKPLIVVLTSGDPLFFGLGRLLLEELPSDWLTFHPHPSSIQLAFSRIKAPWQDAELVSAHGRSLDEVTRALQQGAEKIAILTDKTNTPAAIARLLLALDLPTTYQIWVCENLGGADERVQCFSAPSLIDQPFAPLNVVVLLRSDPAAGVSLSDVPALGIPDHMFLSFRDRPGLMTKREIRVLALSELALQPNHVIWDIGAGTGSVSIEIGRLFPNAQIYAIEQTAAGTTLVQQNCQRFQVNNVVSVHGKAPEALASLPQPDRIFVGGSGGQLHAILNECGFRLAAHGRIVLALATLEHLATVLSWLDHQQGSETSWHHHVLQVQLSRSVPIAALTRLTPLNPVSLITLEQDPKQPSGHT